MKMDRRRSWADICPIIEPGQRIDRILPQVTLLGGFPDSVARCFLERDLIKSCRAIDVKYDAARILADRLGFLLCHLDVPLDDL